MISKIAQILFRIGDIPQVNRFTKGRLYPHISQIASSLASPIVEVDGGYTIKTDDIDTLKLRIFPRHEPEVRDAIRRVMKDGGFAIDIGANIGYHTVLMADLADHVLAFEPENENLELLRWNLKENKCNNVTIIPKAVSDKSNCHVRLWKNQKNKGGHSIIIKTSDNFEEVETVRLDDIVSPEPIRLIKMDIEGAEYEAILGLGSMIGYVDYIIYEHWSTGISKDPAKLLGGWEITDLGGDNYLARRIK